MKHYKWILRIMTCAVVLSAVWCTVTLTGVVAEERKIPIYSVERPDNKIAISFDAAWGNEHTAAILSILEEYDVKTTFFLVDFWAKKFPEDVKTIAAAGHEIGNHSATHPDLGKLSGAEIRRELETAGETILQLTGMQPDLFRPPFGSYSNTLMDTAADCGYHVIQWSRDRLATAETHWNCKGGENLLYWYAATGNTNELP